MDWLGIIVICMIIYYMLMFIRNKLSIGGYNGRHVLITGCDTGFGHLLALRLDEMGFHVYAGCLSEKGEDGLRKKASDKLEAFHFDVTQESSILNALKHVKSKLPLGKGLWGVVNNAGISGPGFFCPAEWLTKQDYDKTLAVNLYGPIETTRVFLPLIRQEQGRIVIMTSIAGTVNTPTDCSYSVSKHALESYANTLRMSARMYGVSVHTIRPGTFATPITEPAVIERNLKAVWARLDPKLRVFYGQKYLDRLIHLWGKIVSSASREPSKVVKAYAHALTARYPRTHYHVGRDAHLSWRLMSLSPTCVMDYLWTFVSPKPAGLKAS